MAETTIDIRKKMTNFENKIMGRVEEQCAAIAQEVEEYRKQELDKYLDGVLGDTKKYLNAEVNDILTSSAREVYTKKVAFKKQLFERRESYSQQVFAQARAKLEDFVQSQAYPNFLKMKAQKLGELYRTEEITLLVRAEDLVQADALRASFGANCTVTASEEIVLGGIVLTCPHKGYRVDESLDTALENQRQWFYEQSGLIVSL